MMGNVYKSGKNYTGDNGKFLTAVYNFQHPNHMFLSSVLRL